MGSLSMPKSTSIFLQIVENEDGSITRPFVPLSPCVDTELVQSKDVILNRKNETWLRVYLPKTNDTKLPIILYFHGGGFVLFSPDFLLYDSFCEKMAVTLNAIVVSLHYRLSPEHRLPAAYDDAVEAFKWIHECDDPWVRSHGDLSQCFLAGSSSGGNIAYHAGLRTAELEKVAGVVMIQPYLGGETRTKSEVESEEDAVLPLRANEMMWRMALPTGADRDHEYCNPMKLKKKKGMVLPRCFVSRCEGDPLIERQKEFVKMLEEEEGVEEVVVRFEDDGYHAVEIFENESAEKLLADVRNFVRGNYQNDFE